MGGCFSHLYWASEGERGRTWFVPAERWGWGWGSGTDPPRTAAKGAEQKTGLTRFLFFWKIKKNKEFSLQPAAGWPHTARWRCTWRGGPAPCRNIGWRWGACPTPEAAAPPARPPRNTRAGSAWRRCCVRQISPWGWRKPEETVSLVPLPGAATHWGFLVYW